MTISNVGSAALSFTLNVVASGIFGGWLSVLPRTGTLEPETNITVTVGYDALGMLEGQYSGRVLIESDALNDQVRHPAEAIIGIHRHRNEMSLTYLPTCLPSYPPQRC